MIKKKKKKKNQPFVSRFTTALHCTKKTKKQRKHFRLLPPLWALLGN